MGHGFPCYLDISVHYENYGSINLHTFTFNRHLTEYWVAQYKSVSLDIPYQTQADEEIGKGK